MDGGTAVVAGEFDSPSRFTPRRRVCSPWVNQLATQAIERVRSTAYNGRNGGNAIEAIEDIAEEHTRLARSLKFEPEPAATEGHRPNVSQRLTELNRSLSSLYNQVQLQGQRIDLFDEELQLWKGRNEAELARQREEQNDSDQRLRLFEAERGRQKEEQNDCDQRIRIVEAELRRREEAVSSDGDFATRVEHLEEELRRRHKQIEQSIDDRFNLLPPTTNSLALTELQVRLDSLELMREESCSRLDTEAEIAAVRQDIAQLREFCTSSCSAVYDALPKGPGDMGLAEILEAIHSDKLVTQLQEITPKIVSHDQNIADLWNEINKRAEMWTPRDSQSDRLLETETQIVALHQEIAQLRTLGIPSGVEMHDVLSPLPSDTGIVGRLDMIPRVDKLVTELQELTPRAVSHDQNIADLWNEVQRHEERYDRLIETETQIVALHEEIAQLKELCVSSSTAKEDPLEALQQTCPNNGTGIAESSEMVPRVERLVTELQELTPQTVSHNENITDLWKEVQRHEELYDRLLETENQIVALNEEMAQLRSPMPTNGSGAHILTAEQVNSNVAIVEKSVINVDSLLQESSSMLTACMSYQQRIDDLCTQVQKHKEVEGALERLAANQACALDKLQYLESEHLSHVLLVKRLENKLDQIDSRGDEIKAIKADTSSMNAVVVELRTTLLEAAEASSGSSEAALTHIKELKQALGSHQDHFRETCEGTEGRLENLEREFSENAPIVEQLKGEVQQLASKDEQIEEFTSRVGEVISDLRERLASVTQYAVSPREDNPEEAWMVPEDSLEVADLEPRLRQVESQLAASRVSSEDYVRRVSSEVQQLEVELRRLHSNNEAVHTFTSSVTAVLADLRAVISAVDDTSTPIEESEAVEELQVLGTTLQDHLDVGSARTASIADELEKTLQETARIGTDN